MAGKIVLSIGCNPRTDDDLFKKYNDQQKKTIKMWLDSLHLAKIDLADEVLILNVDDYIGESTRNELEYAKRMGKKIRFLDIPYLINAALDKHVNHNELYLENIIETDKWSRDFVNKSALALN